MVVEKHVVEKHVENVCDGDSNNALTNISNRYLPSSESICDRRTNRLDTSAVIVGGLAPTAHTIASPR